MGLEGRRGGGEGCPGDGLDSQWKKCRDARWTKSKKTNLGMAKALFGP